MPHTEPHQQHQPLKMLLYPQQQQPQNQTSSPGSQQQQQSSQLPQGSRSRSYSESQKSSRAEKRKGRVFRQQSTTGVTTHNKSIDNNSTNSSSTGSTSYTNNLNQSTTNITNNTSTKTSSNITTSSATTNTNKSNSNSASNNINNNNSNSSSNISTNANQNGPSFVPHENSNIKENQYTDTNNNNINNHSKTSHSQSSSISSQVGSSTSTSTTPSLASNQNTRKLSLSSKDYNDSLSPITPLVYQNISNNISSTSSTVTTPLSSIDTYKHRNDRTETFSRLSTLPESVDDSLDTLLIISKKFLNFYNQFQLNLKSLNINMKLPELNFRVFLKVLDNVEKKLDETENFDQLTENINAHLSVSLINTMNDINEFIDNLRLYLKSNSLNLLSTRTIYFNLFSLFIELVNICKTIVPLSNTKNISYLNSSNHGSIISTHSSQRTQAQPSQFQATKPVSYTTVINRIPAPNPSNSSQSVLNRQPTLNRQNPTLERLDSELSSSSSNENSLNHDDEKLFDLITHIIETYHVVYTQINEAISKTANNLSGDISEFDDENRSLINSKVGELTQQCVFTTEQTRKVKHFLNMVKSNSINDIELNKNLFEQTNLLLKSIINILAAIKSAIEIIPSLNEVRSSLSILTKATKELTIKLESSNLKQSVLKNVPSNSILVEQPQLSSIPSMANFSYEVSNTSTLPQNTSLTSNSSLNTASVLSSSTSIPSNNSLQASQPLLSPTGQQQSKDSVAMRRLNKLRNIPDTNESAIRKMKQHVMNLELNSTKIATEQQQQQQQHHPLTVTTPLIASIGPAVANAVLPINSPLKSSTSFMPNSANISVSTNTIDNNTTRSECTTPNYFTENNKNSLAGSTIHNEYNPFDKLVPRQ